MPPVREDHRGTGVGASLMAAFENEAGNRGCTQSSSRPSPSKLRVSTSAWATRRSSAGNRSRRPAETTSICGSNSDPAGRPLVPLMERGHADERADRNHLELLVSDFSYVVNVPGPTSYILCGTPRTGSTLLCSLLASERLRDCAESYFVNPTNRGGQDVLGSASARTVGSTPSSWPERFGLEHTQRCLRGPCHVGNPAPDRDRTCSRLAWAQRCRCA